jgi:2-dehydro-3-deoxyphosphogluconate aldolase/(4S)-4-hydroxy-2-oxoglutarate aldolase
MKTAEQIAPGRIIPVIVIDDVRCAEPLRDALMTGGIACAEVTFRTPAATEAIERMASDPDFVVGAGTVLNADQARRAFDVGARFVVSPGFSESVVSTCADLQLPVFPGVMTPTEVMQALDAGVRELKFFPAGIAGGIPAIQALSGPFVDVRFIPTGGVNEGNLAEFLSVPSVVAIGGTWLATGADLSSGDYTAISERAARAVRVASAEGKKP